MLDRIKGAWRRTKSKITGVWIQTLFTMKKFWERIKFHILGLKGSTTPGSDARRFYIRLCLYLSIGCLVWAFSTTSSTPPDYSIIVSAGSVLLICASLLVFIQVVLLMPFRDNNDDFKLDTWRLVFDTMVSAAFMITVFAMLYRNVGLTSGNEIIRPSLLDAIYFSSVTFSTLGYGDFAPHPSARMIAATQALLGNLHLGMVVGATFAAIRR